ncbi:WD40-repeat-containing domain protein [Zopfochytrium polystomum]|nr:WD40-repeat-containing domain protein [Zopfochytrium polystomum]
MPNFDTAHALRIEQPVTSLSISPTGKSVVLAAKRGLLIVDLENLDNPPREIKHNTKWEVTDVQWNPHVSRKAWIASTSNQKVLVWNLDPTGTATAISSVANVHHNIEHILQSHQRAVSDLHWSFFHPDILATCSYDNYVHLWDLRVDGKSGPAQSIRPFASFCSWTTGATQVKWSRINENMLASSHDTDLRIWDTRKGSKEVTLITAHRTKINGIDWSPHVESEVITSSQDQTVKFWNINQPRTSLGTITTGSPIWRSRFTPFGSAIVTMPQRKENTLTLWSCDRLDEPVTTFAGHTDVVREFVWRVRGGNPRSADAQFQLVTWSKDQTLRLWPVDNNTLEAVGYQRPTSDKPYLAGASRHPRNIVGSVSQNPSPLPLPSMLQSVASAPSMTLLQQSAALRPGFSSIAASASSQRISTLGRDAVRQVDTAIESNDPLLADAFEPKIANLIKKFPNVTLEKLDKPTRTVYLKIRTTAGWGDTEDGPKQDFVDLNVDIIFPSTRSSQSLYSPRASAPIFDIARSSPISPQCRSHLVTSLSALVRELTKMGEPCLEHCRFLKRLTSPEAVSQRSSGQSSPALSMKALAGQMSGGVVTLKEAPSLDSLADPNRSLNSRSRGKPGTGNDAAKAKNTPYPRLCGASFSKCGKLVCFFSSFPHPKTTAFTNRKTAFHFDNHPKTFAHFESFREFLRKQQPRRMASIPKISDTLGDFETQHHVHAHPHAVDTGMDQSEFSGALAENMANFTIDVEFEDDVFSPPRTHGSLQQPQGATSREDRESAKGLQPITTAKRPSLSVSSASAFIRPVIISPLSPLPRPVRRESADAETRVGSVPTRALRERQLSLDEAVLFASGGVSLQQTPLMLEPIFGTNSSAFFASVPPPFLAGNIATVSHSILGDDDDDDGSSDKSGRGTGGVLLSVSGRNSTGMFPGISDAGGTTTSESADKTSTTRSSDSDTGEAEPVATESIAEKGPQTGAQSLSSERNADTVKKGIGFAVTVKDASDLLPVNRALAEKLR